MKGADRLLAYSAAVLCAALVWAGIVSPAGDWHKPALLVAGVAGLVALALIILRAARWR